jgi:hypothetical protein
MMRHELTQIDNLPLLELMSVAIRLQAAEKVVVEVS